MNKIQNIIPLFLFCIFSISTLSLQGDQNKKPEQLNAAKKKFELSKYPATEILIQLNLKILKEEEMEKAWNKIANKRKEKDFKTSLAQELKSLEKVKLPLEGDYSLSAEQFTDLANSLDFHSSFYSGKLKGTKNGKAYLEYQIFLLSNKSYIAHVHTHSKNLPKNLQEKLKPIE